MAKDSLGDRMKKNYECRSKTYLTRRTPAIIRIDGKAFHTYTKPFPSIFKDPIVQIGMRETARYLVENLQGAMVAYQQSDEISILLNDYTSLSSDAYFNYEVDKICSITASMATAKFNTIMREQFNAKAYNMSLALFDSRVSNYPKEEVTNYFIWRQQDWTRNSIQMLGREYFSHSQLHGKSNIDVMDMLVNEKGVHWNHLETELKRGICAYHTGKFHNGSGNIAGSGSVEVDLDIPIFTKNRSFIEQFVNYTTDED